MIIAREVNPGYVDFRFYFDDEGMTSKGGKNCACYIPGDRDHYGFNHGEYKGIREQAEAVIDGFGDVSDKWTNGYSSYANYKEVLQYNGIQYNPRKCHLLKEWAKTADTSDTDSIAEFLTITTGEKWGVRSFCGYSQGDYCEVIYCVAHYSYEQITEIGKLWLGCGSEFIIDDCGGFFITDDVRWKEGETLRQALAEMYGCKPEELEVYLCDGEHTVTDYKLMEVAS